MVHDPKIQILNSLVGNVAHVSNMANSRMWTNNCFFILKKKCRDTKKFTVEMSTDGSVTVKQVDNDGATCSNEVTFLT